MSTYTDASLIVTPNAVKTGKLYSIVPTDGTGDLTVTRATTATRVNSSGLIESVGANIARLDYSNGSCPSILVEPQRTNLFLRSDMFSDSYWTKGNLSTISANVINSLDGTKNADKHVSANSTSAFAVLKLNQSVIINNSYTFSVFLKKSEVRFVQLRNNINGNLFCNFDLELGTYGIPSIGLIANIQNYGNGWYRCSITATSASTNSTSSFGVNMVTSLTALFALAYPGNGVDGYFVWGAQLEVGSNAASYIPTTTATVTRNADVVSKSGLTGITTITETFEDDTTNVITGSPTSYTMSQGRIKNVIGT